MDQQRLKVTDILREFAIERAGAVSSSLLCEEQVHFMKNAKQTKGARRVNKPQRCMGAVVIQTVASKRFHFKEFGADAPVPKRMNSLGELPFHPAQDKASVDLEGIFTTKQKADYFLLWQLTWGGWPQI